MTVRIGCADSPADTRRRASSIAPIIMSIGSRASTSPSVSSRKYVRLLSGVRSSDSMSPASAAAVRSSPPANSLHRARHSSQTQTPPPAINSRPPAGSLSQKEHRRSWPIALAAGTLQSGHFRRYPRSPRRGRARRRYGSAKTNTFGALPCIRSGATRSSAPAAPDGPVITATYCLPSAAKLIG
jgi:hypothetical protein